MYICLSISMHLIFLTICMSICLSFIFIPLSICISFGRLLVYISFLVPAHLFSNTFRLQFLSLSLPSLYFASFHFPSFLSLRKFVAVDPLSLPFSLPLLPPFSPYFLSPHSCLPKCCHHLSVLFTLFVFPIQYLPCALFSPLFPFILPSLLHFFP